MEKFNITADVRAVDESTKHLRANKKLPAVVYGKSQEAISLTLDYSEFLKMFRKAWESSIINLKVGKKEIEVLVHSFQQEPVSGDYIHVDFYALTRGEAVTTKVHLSFIGESPAVKEGGILEELTKEIEVKCLPRDLVNHFDVDLSLLKEIGDNIKASDLNLWEKYELVTSEEEVLVLISKPKVEKEPEEEVTEGEETTEETWAEESSEEDKAE